MPTAATKQVSRLSDFIIEEVSLVDRAANKRRFLQIKRDDAGDNSNLRTIEPDGRGGFRSLANTDNGAAMTIASSNVTKGIDAVEQIFYKVGDAVDRLMRVASVTLQADSLKLDSGITAATVSEEIDKVVAVLNDVKGEIATAKTLLKAATSTDTAAVEATAKTDEATKTVEQLEKLAAQLKAGAQAQATPTAKAGAAMSAGRLKRFAGALKALLGVLKEVGGDTKALTADDDEASTGGDAEKSLAPAPAPAPAPTAKAAPTDSDDVRKRLAEREAELAQLRKENTMLKQSPAPSQTITVDGGLNPTAAETDFDWPMDMNKPLGRDHVPTEKSFHG